MPIKYPSEQWDSKETFCKEMATLGRELMTLRQKGEFDEKWLGRYFKTKEIYETHVRVTLPESEIRSYDNVFETMDQFVEKIDILDGGMYG